MALDPGKSPAAAHTISGEALADFAAKDIENCQYSQDIVTSRQPRPEGQLL